MILKTKNESIAGAKQEIRDSFRKGFAVSDITSRPKVGTSNPSRYFNDEVWMSTPYVNGDNPLFARCIVDHQDNDILMVTGVELWTRTAMGPEHNLEDICSKEKRPFQAVDRNGGVHSFTEIEQEVADCAAATVVFPHLMNYGEYIAFQTLNYERLKVGSEPTVEDYMKYANHCVSEMRAGDMPYVGTYRDADRAESYLCDLEPLLLQDRMNREFAQIETGSDEPGFEPGIQ